MPGELPVMPYYSNEFFKEATTGDIDEAIADIHNSAKSNDGRYMLYSTARLPKTFKYVRDKNYEPRPNQQLVIDNFKTAIEKGA